jgi:hypothetical protein
MKKTKLIFGVIFICVVSIAFIFFIKKDDDIYTPTIEDINNFTIENNNRYIILYSSEDNKYYLGKVSSYALDDSLYYLGNTACNFKKVNNNLTVISNSEQVVYSSGEYDSLPDKVYDIKTIGNLMITYDSKNHDMQILKRESEAKCILKFKYYNNFIPVDLIET